MTRHTALELIRRLDINAALFAAGRVQTRVDAEGLIELLDQAEIEDQLGLVEPIRWRHTYGNPHQAGSRYGPVTR